MKLVKACIALAAFAALFVVPSIASAIQLTHPTGTTAAVGTKIQATNVAHSATPKNTRMTIPGFANPIECTEATLTGELTANKAGGAAVEGNITTAEFRGHPNSPGTADCDGPLGTVQVTPSHTSNSCHTPTGGVQHCSLPWCVKAGAENIITLRGGKCSEAARPVTFTMHVTGVESCSYQKASVNGTYTTHAAAALATISGQEFTKTTGSIFCPASGKLDMAFTLENETVPATDVYIDAV